MKVKESCFYPKRSWLRRPRNTAIRRCVTVALLVLGLVVGGTSPGWADTKTGRANRATEQLWSFLNGGTGETKVTLSWTNGNAYLLMILVCGTDPLVFGVAASGLNRYAEITAGVPQNTSCLVGVSTVRGASSYRIHLNQTVSEASRPATARRAHRQRRRPARLVCTNGTRPPAAEPRALTQGGILLDLHKRLVDGG